MKRRDKIPDAINCSVASDFVQIPHIILRDPELSAKAKAILCLLLCNREGWETHMTTLSSHMKEGRDAINTGLKELEKSGYLLRIKYRDSKTKQIKGTFWAYTNICNEFDISHHLHLLKSRNYEISPDFRPVSQDTPETGFPYMGFPYTGFPYTGNPTLIILNNKNINEKKTKGNTSSDDPPGVKINSSHFEKLWESYPINRRGSRGSALTGWEKQCRKKDRPTWQRVRAALKRQKKTKQWTETEFVPLLSTWINQQRWVDGLDHMNGSMKKTPEISTGHIDKIEREYGF